LKERKDSYTYFHLTFQPGETWSKTLGGERRKRVGMSPPVSSSVPLINRAGHTPVGGRKIGEKGGGGRSSKILHFVVLRMRWLRPGRGKKEKKGGGGGGTPSSSSHAHWYRKKTGKKKGKELEGNSLFQALIITISSGW